jgi:hypothetical protein
MFPACFMDFFAFSVVDKFFNAGFEKVKDAHGNGENSNSGYGENIDFGFVLAHFPQSLSFLVKSNS